MSNHSGCSTLSWGPSGDSAQGVSLMSSINKLAAVKVARAEQAKDPVQIAEARRELALANIKSAVERNLAVAPPLNEDQIALLSRLLRTGGQ